MVTSQDDQRITNLHKATKTACARWLRHEATRQLVEAERQDVLDRLWPLIEPLVSGDGSWPAAFAFATCAGVTEDGRTISPPGTVRSNGEIDLPARRWVEALNAQNPDRARRALELVHEMRSVARELTERLREAGVPILLDEPSDQIPLVLLLLLNPEDLDWDHPNDLAPSLALVPDVGLKPDGRGITYSDRVGIRDRQDADILRQHFREQQPGFSGGTVRNRGGRPKGSGTKGSVAETVASVLPEVLQRFPDATVAELRRWSGNGDTPGLMLRRLMGKSPGDSSPSASTLKRLLRNISDQ